MLPVSVRTALRFTCCPVSVQTAAATCHRCPSRTAASGYWTVLDGRTCYRSTSSRHRPISGRLPGHLLSRRDADAASSFGRRVRGEGEAHTSGWTAGSACASEAAAPTAPTAASSRVVLVLRHQSGLVVVAIELRGGLVDGATATLAADTPSPPADLHVRLDGRGLDAGEYTQCGALVGRTPRCGASCAAGELLGSRVL